MCAADRQELWAEAGLAGARALRAAELPQPEAGPLRLVRPPYGPMQASTLSPRQREGRLYDRGSSLPCARPLAVARIEADGQGMRAHVCVDMTVLRWRRARLDDFFNNCTAMYGAPCQADIMAVHYYGCTTADLQTCAPWLGPARLSATPLQAPSSPAAAQCACVRFAVRSLAWRVGARSWAPCGLCRQLPAPPPARVRDGRQGRDADAPRRMPTAAAAARRFMVQMAQKYNRPIWLTEFACGGAGTYDQIAQVMQSMLTMLDNQAMVARCVSGGCSRPLPRHRRAASCPPSVFHHDIGPHPAYRQGATGCLAVGPCPLPSHCRCLRSRQAPILWGFEEREIHGIV
jgi:hypothetical protein